MAQEAAPEPDRMGKLPRAAPLGQKSMEVCFFFIQTFLIPSSWVSAATSLQHVPKYPIQQCLGLGEPGHLKITPN